MKADSLAVLGGTFNPIHLGHLHIAETVRLQLGYDLIVFIPSMIPAHKAPDRETLASLRVEMLEIALREHAHFICDDCEVKRGGVSYTIDTVAYIKSEYRLTGKPGLIIGDDLLAGFSRWKRVDELVAQVDLIVARRISQDRIPFQYAHKYLRNQVNEVASRDLRSMVKRGENIDRYVPAGVGRYIREKSLYRR